MAFNYENNLKSFSKRLNIFVTKYCNENIINDNWRAKIQVNHLNKLKKKNNIVSLVNKLAYLDKDNFENIDKYKEEKKKQNKILDEIKIHLSNKDNDVIFQNLYDLFFETKQDLLFKFIDEKKNKLTNKYGHNIKYLYLLEDIIFQKQYHEHLSKIFEKILNKFLNFEFVLITDKYKLTPFSKLFLNDELYENITNNKNEDDDCITLILDIKNKLQSKVLIYLLLINLMIKHKVIKFDKYYILLDFIKVQSTYSLNSVTDNIITKSNLHLWHYYYIINYALFNNNTNYFNKNKKIINNLYTENNKQLLIDICNRNTYFKYL